MFTVQFRDEVRERIITKAKSDSRIVSAAVIGSYAKGNTDRWSDIDLTFGVSELFTPKVLIDSFTDYVKNEFEGVVLFDVQRERTVYRVFVLPGCIQLDLSFSTASEFGAIGQHFNLLYGKEYKKAQIRAQPTKDLFGYIIHHILRARFCMERNRFWQAGFWINEARNCILSLACVSRGLNGDYARGFDDLSHEILDSFKDSLVKEFSRGEIMRCIRVIIPGLPNISGEVNDYSIRLISILNELAL